jgi:hypothetical protein
MPVLLKVSQDMVFQGHNSKSPDSKRANQGRKQKHLFPLVTLWIQDLLEPQESTTGFDTNSRTDSGDQRGGGSEWEPIKILPFG